MATLSPTTVTLAGIDQAAAQAAASAGGDEFSSSGKQYLVITNADASPHTVTVDDPNSVAPTDAKQFNPDVDIVVDAGTTVIAGPFTATRFVNSSDSLVHLTYDAVTSLTIGVIRVS